MMASCQRLATTRGPAKNGISAVKFTRQLAQLWQNNAVLRVAAAAAKVPERGYFYRTKHGEERRLSRYRIRLPPTWHLTRAEIYVSRSFRNGYGFIPLVRSPAAFGMRAEYRKGGDLISAGGDLDNRIKVLFDCLRLPSEEDLKKEKPDAEPFYCLLEDGGLITSFSVNADRLWSRRGSSDKEVRLIIGVTIKVTKFTAYNVGFLGS